ncbi:MAG TPA: tetratricopeptide repeat protein [Candidatus Competibacteraceae bacterium]|nr:tetratricopeptide repeat protein [Candidatus Competibacteraceae bacterium]
MYTALKVATLAAGLGLILAATAQETQMAPDAESIRRELAPRPPSLEREILYRVLLAELAGKRGRMQEAMQNYLAAAHASTDPRLAERALGVALYLKDEQAALDMARRWQSLEPQAEGARRALAVLLLRVGEVDGALAQLDQLRQNNRNNGQDGFGMVAAALSQIEDKELVLHVLEIMRSRRPDDIQAHYYHALTALGLNRPQLALDSLAQVLQRAPEWSAAHLLKAQVLLDMGRRDEALADLEQALARYPEQAELRMGYARLLVSARRLDEAEAQFRRLVEAEPSNGEALYALGLLNAETRRYEQARGYFLRALELKPEQQAADLYIELGKLDEAQGRFAEARGWYERVPEGERYLGAQLLIGGLLAKGGDLAGMTAQLATLRQRYPRERASLYIAEAEILRDVKQYQRAFTVLDEALQQFPDDPQLRYSRALAAERIDRLDVLEQDLRALIESNPENGQALNALGYTLADRTDRYQEALGYLERAIALLPEDAAVLDSMGWVKYRLGDYPAALEYLRKAYARSQDGEITAHLCEVLWHSGSRDEALELWRQAIGRMPEDEHLREVQQRFGWQ